MFLPRKILLLRKVFASVAVSTIFWAADQDLP
jgi:hypothetical protein